MSTVTVNGQRAATLSLTMPYYGTWSADVKLAVGATIATGPKAVTIAIGDLSLVGTVVRQATFAGDTSARIVGGAAGWRKEIAAKGYSHERSVLLSTVLADAARASGESIVVDADRTLGTHWTRDRAKAEKTLKILLGGQWWMDPSGTTQTVARSNATIATPFTMLKRNGSKGLFEVSTEMIASWQPGRRFSSPTVTDVQTISSVTIEADNEGKLRLVVLSTEGATERLRADFSALVQSELDLLNFSGVWEYEIVAASEQLVDVVPTDPRMPTIRRCSLMPGIIGELVTPTVGSMCRVAFVNQNPARPEVIGIVGAPVLAKLGGGSDFVALAALVASQLSSIEAAFTALVLPVAGASAGPPTVPPYTAGAVAATKLKAT